jgi:hypothetical protein
MDGGDAGVHLREYAYWQHALSGRRAGPHRVRGDVIVRLSARCIVRPNEQSDSPFSLDDGGSDVADPYALHGGIACSASAMLGTLACGSKSDLASPRSGKRILVHTLSCSVWSRTRR